MKGNEDQREREEEREGERRRQRQRKKGREGKSERGIEGLRDGNKYKGGEGPSWAPTPPQRFGGGDPTLRGGGGARPAPSPHAYILVGILLVDKTITSWKLEKS